MALLAVALALTAPGIGSARPVPRFARDAAFDGTTVIELARWLSTTPYAPLDEPLPDALARLDYDQYGDIRFRPAAGVWAGSRLKFQLQLFHRGYLFVDPVEIAIVKGGKATHLAYRADLFATGALVTEPLPAEDIGFAGFRLHYPINRADYADEVAVFQGASYFRSLGRRQVWGQSARGLALKTAEPEGEEFPAFRAFWIEEPRRHAGSVVVHALLDSPSVTGAYRFAIQPGDATVMDVEAVLFPRVELTKVGLAPATSMFLRASGDGGDVDDFRPHVHDTDGLLMLNGGGECLWRPLTNPKQVQVSAFQDRSPRGFGLLQRDRDPKNYQDFQARYDLRPSLWVEPGDDWGPGAVVLTEIPSKAEIHDNMVAFWAPAAPLAAGSVVRVRYRITWGGEPAATAPCARVLATRSGLADLEHSGSERRFVIDYDRPAAKARRPPPPLPTANATVTAGKVRDVVVSDNPITGGYRVSFVFDPGETRLAELRLELDLEDPQRAETWVYRWTAD